MTNNFNDDQNLLNCSDIGSPDCKVAVLDGSVPPENGGTTIKTNLTSISGLTNEYVWNLVNKNLELIGLKDDIYGLSRTFEFFCCGTYTKSDVQTELYNRWKYSGGMSGPSVYSEGNTYNTFGTYFDFILPNTSLLLPYSRDKRQTPFFQILNPYFYYITYQLFENINGFNKVNTSLAGEQKQALDNLLSVLNNPFGVGSLLIKKYCDNTFFNNSDYINSIDKNNKALNIRSALSNTYLGRWCGSGLSVGEFLIDDGTRQVGKGANINTHCEPFANYNNGLKNYNNVNYYVNNDVFYSDENTEQKLNLQNPYGAKSCINQEICVINNVVTNTANDEGTINFNQYCRGCQEGGESCLCYILNPSTLSKMSGMGSPVKFSLNCKGGQCYFLTPTKDNGTSMKAVSCGNQPGNSGKLPPSTVNGSGISDVNESRVVGDSYEYGITLWNIPIYFLVFGIIFLLLLEIMDRNVKKIFKKVGITNKEVHIKEMSKLPDKKRKNHEDILSGKLPDIEPSLSNLDNFNLDNINI
jgi:hypothetical protein